MKIYSLECSGEKKERGASLVEYALLVALIAVVGVGSMRVVGLSINKQFQAVAAATNFPHMEERNCQMGDPGWPTCS